MGSDAQWSRPVDLRALRAAAAEDRWCGML